MVKYISKNYKLMILFICILSFTISGCKKKQPESPFQSQLPDTTSTITVGVGEDLAQPAAVEEANVATSQTPDLAVAESTSVDVASPTLEEIQTALKNAGYYKGEIDGKIGPKSKQAILDFQNDNGLNQDGKVGPKTWSKLKEYLKSQQ